MPVIAVTDSPDLLASAVERLKAEDDIDVRVLPAGLSSLEAARAAADAEAILISTLPFPAEAIDALDATGLIVRCGIGVDIVDLERAATRGIRVANVPDYCVNEVADHTMMLMLMAARRAQHFISAWTRNGQWATQVYEPVPRLAGRTLGLIGLGRIGSLVAQRARGFGLKVVAFDPGVDDQHVERLGVTRRTLGELLAESDLVSLHLPLTTATRHLLDRDALSQMRRGAILINTSRGPLVDLDALAASISDGHVSAAGLDVVEGEPTPDPAHPVMTDPRVVVTPHVAWYSSEARRDLGIKAAENALAFVRGHGARHVVNGVDESFSGHAPSRR